ncbi:hypothetical protein KSZ_12200 [Dictyobacter formicarum]|uniref:Uncharacterized protein n=1 Tax=Dictyobacter formicarum TaxID=2778368 RepID=A0ABQ3VBT2_9CHLR|nr:hypothetical protein KSZ_12200 [Dictyobacter formicarum]
MLIVTTTQGATRLHEQSIPPAVQVTGVLQTDLLSAQAVCAVRSCQIILVEGGP